MIIVHHLENSRSQRVLWLLEELGLEYEVKRYERDKTTSLAPPALKKVHPLGKSPIIEDDGKVLAETGAIIEYLVETYGDGALIPPVGTQERLDYRYWLHFAEGSIAPNLVMKLIFVRIKETKVPFPISMITKGIANRVLSSFVEPNLQSQAALIEDTLSKSPWFAGEAFSAADIQMSFAMEAFLSRVNIGKRKKQKSYPQIEDFVTRIHARPAYQTALERGGPYTIMS